MELALEYLYKALKIEQLCFGAIHPTCARTLNEIGHIELDLGNIMALMSSYSDALHIYIKTGIGDDHFLVSGQKLWRFDIFHPRAAAVA
jgi:hypothetical protein